MRGSIFELDSPSDSVMRASFFLQYFYPQLEQHAISGEACIMVWVADGKCGGALRVP